MILKQTMEFCVIILFYLNIGDFLFICEDKAFGELLLEYYEYPVK